MSSKVNLGAGRQAREHPGYIGVDIISGDGIDYVWDCERGLPKRTWERKDPLDPNSPLVSTPEYRVFQDNTVDEFLCKHFLEHIRNLNQLMEEIWDALKPSGILKVYVPNAECPRAAWGDPGHVRAFSVLTMGYYTTESQAAFPITEKPWRILEGYPKVNGTAPNDLYEIEWWMSPDK